MIEYRYSSYHTILMSDRVEAKLTQTTDAVIWASEFMALFGHCREQINFDLMLGWFANAIETGRSQAGIQVVDDDLEADLIQQVAIAHSMISTDGEVFTKGRYS